MRQHHSGSMEKISSFEKFVITCLVSLFIHVGFVAYGYAEDWLTKQGFHYNADHFYFFGCRLQSFEPHFGIEKNHYRARFMLTAAAEYEIGDKTKTVNTQYKLTVELSWSPIDNRVEESITIQAVVPKSGEPRIKATLIGESSLDPVLHSSGGQPPGSYKMISVSGALYTDSPLKADENEMNVYATTNEGNWKVATNNLLTLAFVHPEIATQLRQKYKEWIVPPTVAPLITSPKENSVQKDPKRVLIDAFLPWAKTWPCGWWRTVIILNRWDSTQGTNGGWKDTPHSYRNLSNIDEKGTCRGSAIFSLKPGKYRISCRAEHARSDVKSSPYSLWIPFEVAMKVSKEAAEVSRIRIKSPKSGTTWYRGNNHSISWHSLNVPGKVKIFLVRGKGMVALSTSNRYELSPPGGMENTGYWRRNLPIAITPDENYRVLVQSVDDPKVQIFSDYFSIRIKMDAATGQRVLKKSLKKVPDSTVIQLPEKPALKSGIKPDKTIKKLKLKAPLGMETWYIGKTYPIKWQSTGIDGRVRIYLVKGEKKQLLTDKLGVDINKRIFNWKIGNNISPGSMYEIYLKTLDGKVKSKKSGGFNIKMKLNSNALKKKRKPKIKEPPKGEAIKLD